MPPSPISVSRDALRRFLVHRLALHPPRPLPDVAAALDRLEFVQMDSIHVCGRMHDLILRARIPDYSPDDLTRFLYVQRAGFEYYFNNLCVLPVGDLRYFVAGMEARAAGTASWGVIRDAADRAHAEALLERIRAEGPKSGRDLEAGGHTVNAWGSRSKRATWLLERLYLQGRLGIAGRRNFDRCYDLMERLFPALEPAPAEETRARLALKRCRAQRLFKLKPEVARALPEGAVVPVKAEGIRSGWHVLAEDLAELEAAEALPVSGEVTLLAPLDPLVYDRPRTKQLFDFDYTWEVYTPEAKRRWGYYVLPVLQGDRLVGRVDPKLDRRRKCLVMHSVSLEPGIDVAAVAGPLAARLRAFACWLGAERIELGRVEPEALRVWLEREGAESLG